MNDKDNLLQKSVGGMVWKFSEKVSAQLIQMVIQIILARLLVPEEYALVGLLAIFINISDVIILQGLTTALIQKKDPDEIDYASVFYTNLAGSVLLYGVLYVSAPAIAAFYNESKIVDIMRVLAINVVLGAIPAVHNAIIARKLEFKKSFIQNIGNSITQGIVGIPLAIMGYGAWAMVFSKVAGMLVGTIILCAIVPWSPKGVYSIKHVKKLFSFSSKVLVTNLLNTVFNNIHSLIIGRYYSKADLGYYQRGQQIPQVLMGSLDGSMTEVLYPTFAKFQGDVVQLKKALRFSVKTSMYIVLPVLFGMIATAESMTLVLLTEKWLPSVPYMQYTCVLCMFWPLSHRTHAINAIGRSDVTLKLSIIGKTVTLVCLIVCIRQGMKAIMMGSIIASVICLLISTAYVKKYLQYSGSEMLLDIISPLTMSIGMAAVVMLVGELSVPAVVRLILQVITGVILYVSVSFVTKNDTFLGLLNRLKGH